MTLDQLKDLIAKQDDAQRQAATVVRNAHEVALEAAQELRESLADTVGDDARRDRLKGIIEAAAGTLFPTKASLQVAAVILGQHAAAAADRPGVPASAGRDGKWLIAHAMSSTAGYTPEQRQKVLGALVLAASGAAIETGLIEFPAEWWSFPSLANLSQMAEAMDAEAVAAMQAEETEQAALLAEAMRLEDALMQARPALFAVGDSDTALTVTVKNHRGGSITIAGHALAPGDNELTAAEYSRLRDHKAFKAHAADGALEVVSQTRIVEDLTNV